MQRTALNVIQGDIREREKTHRGAAGLGHML